MFLPQKQKNIQKLGGFHLFHLLCPQIKKVIILYHEISIIEGVIEENVEVIIDRWKNYFGIENDK